MFDSAPTARRAGLAAALGLAAGVLAAPAPATAQDEGESRTIAEVVASDERFSLLAHSVNQAGLAEALGGEGPITVFAPTDDAWDAVGEEALEPYMRDPERLSTLLKRHVVVGPVEPTDRTEQEIEVETLAGEEIAVDFGAEPIEVGEDARVVEAGIEASNGIIHAIDDVLLDEEG
jgi:uncharacterized surface protein with fasciclin (FAS1) repeats